MWIENNRGKLRLCTRYKDPVSGSLRKASVALAKDTPQARNRAAAALDLVVESRTSIAPEVMRLSDLSRYYLSALSREVKPTTMERNGSKCRTFLRIFGDVDVNKLTAGAVRARFFDYSDKPSTFNENLIRFKALLRWGYRNDLVRDIQFLEKLAPLKDDEKREKLEAKFLEADECAALVQAMTVPHWRDLTQFLVLSGLRIGEAMALTDEDLDFDRRMILVTKTLGHNTGIVTDPKTFASRRSVYMQDDLLALSRRVAASARRNRRILLLGRGQPLFAPLDALTPYNAYRKYLRETSEAVLGRPITPHVLRHTHASLLAEQGLSYDEIARRLGHGDSKVTRAIYVHVTERRKEKENERIRELHLVNFA